MHPVERSRLALLAVAASVTFLVLPPQTFIAAFVFTAVAVRYGTKATKTECTDRRTVDLLTDLCTNAQLPLPRLCLSNDPGVWASARGITPRKRCLVVSAGALSLPDDELRAVLAHELGHYAAWDNLDALIWLPALLATLRGGGYAAEWTYQHLHLVAPAPLPTNLATVAVLGPGTLLLLAVLAATRRSEERADTFAARLTGNREALTTVIARLPSHRLPEILTAHPSPRTRIHRLRNAAPEPNPSTS